MSVFLPAFRHGSTAPRLALAAFVAFVGLAASTAVAQQRRPDRAASPAGPEGALAIDPDMRWERVPGCARDIAATAADIVLVTGCDVGRGGASGVYRWNGSAFAAYPAGGSASAVATHGGSAHAVGSDAGLYTSAADGVWRRRGTPNGRPITDVGAGRAGLWIVTSQPNGIGGNAIARATPCPVRDGRLLPEQDFCGWQEVPGAAMRISVGANVWVATSNRELYEWNEEAAGWERRPGCFTDVAAGARHVYAVACERGEGDGHRVLRWNRGGGWIDTGGAAERVAVDDVGNVWVVTASGQIWRSVPPRR